MDGGATWEDFKVSDVAFTPTPISGLADSYMGDYLSITARGSQVYPVWTDYRNGLFMTYTSPYVTNNLPKPTDLTIQLDEFTGVTTLNWLFSGEPFLYFNVYRDGILLGTTTDLTYSDQLPDFGLFTYGVTAVHDEGESVAASASIQWGNPHIYVAPDAIETNLLIGTSTVESVMVKNIGELDLEYTVTPLINNKKKNGKDYCAASGGCDEYIANVTFGDIDNSSSCDNYHDYSDLSTVVSSGQSYTITVTNGSTLWSDDQCGVWVDWNQDQDFYDAGESMNVSGSPGVGPYTATITPPEGAVPGETRLRVRITYTGSVDPCGATSYGEVEDYSVFVLGWLMIDNYGGTLAAGDSALINVTLDATDLTSGIYSAELQIGSNDPDVPMVTVPITLTVGEDIPDVTAWADPAEICYGDTTQLFAEATGGLGTYTYSWTSVPEGFTSTDQQPVVTPLENTLYIVQVNDGLFSVFDSTEVTVAPFPGTAATPTGEIVFCINPENTTYNSEGAEFALSYMWTLTPETAGVISGGGTTGIVDWNAGFTGEAFITITGINDCGTGITSEILTVTINALPEVTMDLAIDTVYTNTPEFALTAGQPEGGVYSGNGVTESGGNYYFNASVAGVGEQTITYIYIDGNGCSNSATDMIFVKQWMGINKIVNGIQLEIYPNPSKGTFTLKLRSRNPELLSLKIINSLGKSVFEEQNINTGSAFSRMIDMTNAPEGLYFINLYSNETSYIEKIVIRK
jgi:hypothetical protein